MGLWGAISEAHGGLKVGKGCLVWSAFREENEPALRPWCLNHGNVTRPRSRGVAASGHQTTLGASGCVEGEASARRPGSASSLSVSAARRRLPSRTQSQAMNVAVLFYRISNFRLHFESSLSAYPLDKDSEQIRSRNLQSNESSRDCCRWIIVRSDFFS
jgi:hypothetical protein